MTGGAFSDVRILMIEDQLFLRALMVRMLNGLGFKDILQARDGKEALEIVSAAGDAVDVILCDLRMPTMDGFEFIAALRASPAESVARIPVIVLTGTSDTKSVHRLRALGIAGYIVKPASPRAIAERVSAALRAPRRDGTPASAG